MPLHAGAAAVDITPTDSQFLFGYPHVPRMSTGVHDPLLASALYLCDNGNAMLLISCDVIFISKETAARVRKRIHSRTLVPRERILVPATHTHSGPMTLDMISNEADSIVPGTDPAYVALMEDGIVDAAVRAFQEGRKACLAVAETEVEGLGGNRRDPAGPAQRTVPVLRVDDDRTRKPMAVLQVCAMHPTVLHEDSTLVSGDFPGLARQRIQEAFGAPGLPVLHCTGAAGNQSPRHVTRANTFEEARRLGDILGNAVAEAAKKASPIEQPNLGAAQATLDLPRKEFPSVSDAEKGLAAATEKLETLRAQSAPATEIRTAEVDWFGAEETLVLARAAAEGRLDAAAASCLPAEVQAFRIGPLRLVAWPGEVFVEYALELQEAGAFLITLANGDTQGYIVTEKAARLGGYEASNSLFHHKSGQLLLEASMKLLREI